MRDPRARRRRGVRIAVEDARRSPAAVRHGQPTGSIRIESASSRERSRRFSTSSSRRCDCCERMLRSCRSLLRRELVAAHVERLGRAVDRRDGRAELVRRERRELSLQLVQAPELAVRDRLLEERRDERAEGRQQVDLPTVEHEGLAALVARHEAEAAALAEERECGGQWTKGKLGTRRSARLVRGSSPGTKFPTCRSSPWARRQRQAPRARQHQTMIFTIAKCVCVLLDVPTCWAGRHHHHRHPSGRRRSA